MITRVDTVLIGKSCPASYTTVDALSAGDVAVFDEKMGIIKTSADALAAKSLYVGVCQGKVNVTMPDGTVASKSKMKFSNEIQKGSKPSYVIGTYVAPVQDKIEFDLTSADITIGHRYVLRVVYKDIYEAPGQFTHTYEVVATSETASVLGAALLAKINKHVNRRISATFASNKLTITALAKNDNEEVNSLNEYSIVSMDATLYSTKPGALLSNNPEAVSGVTITKTVGKPGKGYWKQVRDAELRAMGYAGHVATGAYPSTEQARVVEKDATYDYMTIENDNTYLTPDNQRLQTTPLITELYVKASSLGSSVVADAIEAFVTGVDPNAATA